MRNIKALIWFFKKNNLLLTSVVEANLAFPMNTDQDLLQPFMRMMPPHNALHGVIHIVNTLDAKGNVVKFFQSHEHPARIAMRLEHIFYNLHSAPI